MHPTIEARELVAKWMIEHGFATGHGDTVDDLLSELEGGAHERAARLVSAMVEESPWRDQQWARAALAIAASAIKRGRHLTEAEKLRNLADAMAEDDELNENAQAAATLRDMAAKADAR